MFYVAAAFFGGEVDVDNVCTRRVETEAEVDVDVTVVLRACDKKAVVVVEEVVVVELVMTMMVGDAQAR